MTEEPEVQMPKVLSSCSSARRRTGDSSSPEFEFWMVRNPSFPQPNLPSADELFSDGVLLPLHLLHPHYSSDDPNPTPAPESESEPSGSDRNGCETGSAPGPSSILPVLSASAPTTTSKRWKDIIFKKTDRRSSRDGGDDSRHPVKEKDKERRKEKKGSGVGGGNNPLSAAELNINIWPFSRSRSAGNGGTRPRMAAGASRKVSSAPCSRSNSAGESKSRKWPSSPSRGGVHLGRSSPVWQVRRAGSSTGKGGDIAAARNAEKPLKKEGNECRRKTTGAVSSGGGAGKAKVLQLNVPMCIGYRHHLSCRSDENSAVSVAAAAAAAATGSSVDGGSGISGNSSDEGIRGSNLFNFRNLFTKKVH